MLLWQAVAHGNLRDPATRVYTLKVVHEKEVPWAMLGDRVFYLTIIEDDESDRVLMERVLQRLDIPISYRFFNDGDEFLAHVATMRGPWRALT